MRKPIPFLKQNVRRNVTTLSDEIRFIENNTDRVRLPTTGYITELSCTLHVTYSTGASPVPNEDAFLRLIKGIRITATGGRTYFDMQGGREWFFWNSLHYKSKLRYDPITTDPNQTDVTAQIELPIHFGITNYFDPFDPSIVIPAVDESSLNLEVDWGNSADLGTDYTIDPNNTYISITMSYLLVDNPELVWSKGIVKPIFEEIIVEIDSTYSNLALERSLTVGVFAKELMIMVTDASDNRSDYDVKEVGIKFPKVPATPYREDWYSIVNKNKRRFELDQPFKGIALIPMSDLTGNPFGADLTTLNPNDIQLGFTTRVAGGKIRILQISLT